VQTIMAEKSYVFRENFSAVEDEFPDDVTYSDDEIFYPTSNEVSRQNIETTESIGASESVDRKLYEATRDAFSWNQQEEYVEQLHKALDKQDEEIKRLDNQLKELRLECSDYFKNLEEKLACFEEKVDLVINLVSSWASSPARAKICRGYCSKHIRTEKCLCRGLREPHRCCGHLSGSCDC